jgi:mono/diheme cytochrome c family protein
VRQANKKHDVSFPFSWRFLQYGWRLLYFSPERFAPAPGKSASYNRGAYLATSLAHCAECHTPRNSLGALNADLPLAGTADGPDGQLVPNITPDKKTGIGDWAKEDIVELLKSGETPEQAKVKGAMRETVEDGLKYLSQADLEAIADYLLAQAPIAHDLRRSK